jgi:hypothetical protein
LLHAPIEVKSRVISRLSSLMLPEKLNQLKQKYPRASKKHLYDRLSVFLNRVCQRERSARRFRG